MNQPEVGWLISGVSASAVGRVFDTRLANNYAYLYYSGGGNSAIFDLQASHDATAWMVAGTYTATAGGQGTAQIAAYYPFVRVNARLMYSAAGGSAKLAVYYAPGLGG